MSIAVLFWLLLAQGACGQFSRQHHKEIAGPYVRSFETSSSPLSSAPSVSSASLVNEAEADYLTLDAAQPQPFYSDGQYEYFLAETTDDASSPPQVASVPSTTVDSFASSPPTYQFGLPPATSFSPEHHKKFEQPLPLPAQPAQEKKHPTVISVPQKKPVAVPVEQPVAVPVEHKVPVEVPVPVKTPVAVPVRKDIPVPVKRYVDEPFEVPVDIPIEVPVDVPVPVPVKTPVPVPEKVEYRVRVHRRKRKHRRIRGKKGGHGRRHGRRLGKKGFGGFGGFGGGFGGYGGYGGFGAPFAESAAFV